ncbi:hypothetical protein A2159_03120 [Candidatus Woesebacteria bacterium RBG_13_34_9]|uniref:HEPN domain-containing protein n=1 Tax=Candidatus Woesebacteria bacterium RBG_13_34_9 TaxID=1802477 RepID=A0A1F7X2E1_9BACT|nr:MAG: hypothetical protein A2159_03120 [Candidatus Woesebacteria bacterium RBG_13_34_9]
MSKNKDYETPETFLKLAKEYFRALLKFEEVYKNKVPDISKIETKEDYEKIKSHRGYPLLFTLMNVKLFLVRHSLELGLKSFLLHKGVTINKLRDRKLYHHNLENCLNGVWKYGLQIFNNLNNEKDHTAIVLIKKINMSWEDKIYEYPNKYEKIYTKEYLYIIKTVLKAVSTEFKNK